MAEDLKSEFKSRRSSLGGSGGFHGNVQQVSEASDREYYAFLNVTPDCSEDEIKAAFRDRQARMAEVRAILEGIEHARDASWPHRELQGARV